MSATLAHELPGRLRFSLPSLRRDTVRATALRDRLAALPGVTAASANPLTGSVLVLHDGGAVTRERIIAAIEPAGYRPNPNHPVRPAGVSLGLQVAIAHPLTRIVAEKLLERLVVSALAVII